MNKPLKKLPLGGMGGLIKVCGMRDPDNIRAVTELGIDLMGFIFWNKTPRCVLEEQKCAIMRQKFDSKNLKYVGVFVDEQPQEVLAKVNEYHLDYVQLHGGETPEYIDTIQRSTDAKIIKAISIREGDDVKRWREYAGHVDMLLFDTKCTSTMLSTGACVGGSGEQFDWSVLGQYDGDIPFLLSGGIGPDDAERIKAFHHPKCIGIDLNSKFEDLPGLKNIDKLRNFIKSLS